MSELPKGWEEVPLQDLVIFALGGDWGKDCNESLENYVKVKVVRGTEFRNWKTQRAKTAAERCVKKSSLESRNLTEGDIVVEISGGGPTQPVGRTIVIDQKALESSDAPLVCSNFFRQVKLHDSIESRFVNYFLNFTWAKGGFDEFQTQTTNLRNLNFTQFLNETLVTLPPLNEQKRIVEKLEILLGKVEAVQARLSKIPVILKRFRQAVLAAACSGKLTADWRLENQNLETASEIIENLKNQRLADAKNLTEKEKITAIYDFVEESDSQDLPENWRFAVLNKICNSYTYGTSTKSDKEGLVAVLRMGNIQSGKLDWTDLVYTSDKSEIEKYRLKPNSVLFNRTNSPELVGKTAIYRGEQEAIFAGYLIRINNFDCLDSEYLNCCLNTTFARDFCLQVKTDGVSQSNINAQKLGLFELAMPPIAEQKEIVRRVEDLFKFADQIEARYKKARSYTDKLTQSILAKAFRGELVPQDENDDPASILLERIKAEKSSNTVSVKGKQKRKPKTLKEDEQQTLFANG